MAYTAWFDEIRKEDIALVGGKGANLGELSHAGLPVPPGFVITTAAYDTFVKASGIKGEVVALASVPRAEDPAGSRRSRRGSARCSPAARFPMRWRKRSRRPSKS